MGADDLRVAIAWNGLPFYAARLVQAGIKRVDVPVDVLGSKPSVPIQGMEEALGQPIHWIDSRTPQSWGDLNVPMPDLFVHTGWAYSGFNALAREVRSAGGRVVAMVDNRWKKSLRQWAGALVFRARYRRRFDAVWVPGRSARKLCRVFGIPSARIYEGMYGADPEVFTPGAALPERAKRMLFVGQLIPRKGVDILLDAFRRFRVDDPEWTLRIIGEGEMAIPESQPGISASGFLQPHDVAKEMRASRFLVCPSRDEHWGLVVHEAALSGCGLIASDHVGAAQDLVTPENGIVHASESVAALERAMRAMAEQSEEWLIRAMTRSRELAMGFGPEAWADSFQAIVDRYAEFEGVGRVD